MREPLESALGLYSPSFFKMYIGVREQIDDVFNLSPVTSAVFLHEYVHFLQDITTIYGQKNIISVVDYIKTVNFNQRASGNTVLPIPYIPQHRDGGAYYNSELEKLHLGTRRLNFAGTITEIIVSILQQDVGNEIKDIEQIELKLPGKDHSYRFGSHAIIESMAYEIEQAVYPGLLATPEDFCYTAAAEVIRFCYPALTENRLHIVAFCDATLMYYNPAAVFYHALTLIVRIYF